MAGSLGSSSSSCLSAGSLFAAASSELFIGSFKVMLEGNLERFICAATCNSVAACSLINANPKKAGVNGGNLRVCVVHKQQSRKPASSGSKSLPCCC